MRGLINLLIQLAAVSHIANCIRLASEYDFEEDKPKSYELEIRMKNAHIQKKEDSRCTFVKLEPETQFITDIQINGIKEINHHISLIGCETIPDFDRLDNDNSWNCGEIGICGGSRKTRRIYTWALDAQGINMQPGVGYKVSGNTGLNYLVIQAHYNDKVEVGYSDSKTAYVLQMTSQKLPYQTGVYTLGDNGQIPAKHERYHMDSGCRLKLNYDIVPIFYRTHAHNIIPVISGYLIKGDEWTELGRMSPKQPEAFYDVTYSDQIVRKGDWLASRCTANSMDREKTTYTGHLHEDEMCVFYLMFYTDYDGVLTDRYCFHDLYEDSGDEFSWENDMPGQAPDNSETLKGVHLVKPEYELIK